MQYKPLVWIIVALVGIIVLLIIFWPSGDNHDNQVFYDRIAELEQRDKAKDVQNKALLNRINSDSIKHADSTKFFIREINGLKTRLSKQRVRIDTLVIENPELARYVELSDSTIQAQEVQITSQASYISELQTDINIVNSNCDERLRLHAEKNKLLADQIPVLRKEIRKQRREKKAVMVIGIVAVVGALLIQ